MTGSTRTVCVVDRRRLVREGIVAAASRLAPTVRWSSAASAADVAGDTDVVLLGEHGGPVASHPVGSAVVRFAAGDDLAAVVARVGAVAVPGPARPAAAAVAPDPLTARERQVLAAVGRGGSAAEIGRELGVSPRTVEKHKQVVLAKLGARSQAEAVAIHAGARS